MRKLKQRKRNYFKKAASDGNFKRHIFNKRALVDGGLDGWLDSSKSGSALICRAMRSAVKGGKRIRPVLTLFAAEACGGRSSEALSIACGIELIHTYSLVHDDLPCMDNDDFRRGRQTVHKRFGEAVGVLAGDALLTLGFELLSQGKFPQRNIEVIKVVSSAIGTKGMIGGQMEDIERFGARGSGLGVRRLEEVARRKTGALIAASLKAGGVIAGGPKVEVEALARYGGCIGMCFQLVDDILDKDGLCGVMPEDAVRKKARDLTEEAKGYLSIFGGRAERLREMAEFILRRRV